MRTALHAISAHPNLALQLVVTGMHLDRAHGRSIETIRTQGWKVDATVAWPRAVTAASTATSTGSAMAKLALVFERLKSGVVLVVGDRVEAFAAASAAHISGCIVAHVHGGDRALGQVDDALRHAITKLAHIHFPATMQSAQRIRRLGEDAWRIHRVGSPGLDGIHEAATVQKLVSGPFSLVALHPTSADEARERHIANSVLRCLQKSEIPCNVVVHPNNDPGNRGISRVWDRVEGDARFIVRRDVPRSLFLGLMRDAAFMIGNSSSGIIEAASFGTPVIDIGDRQKGRERSGNAVNVSANASAIQAAIEKIWRKGRSLRFRGGNVYGTGGAGVKIASILARLSDDPRLRRKLIAY